MYLNLSSNVHLKTQHYTQTATRQACRLFQILSSSQYSDGLNSRGLIPGKGNDFSLLHSFQTGSGDHAASNPMGTGDSVCGGDYSLPSSTEVNNGGAVPPFPPMSS
jgi:hypothetical protein